MKFYIYSSIIEENQGIFNSTPMKWFRSNSKFFKNAFKFSQNKFFDLKFYVSNLLPNKETCFPV